MHLLTAQQLAAVHTVSDHAVNPVSGEIAFTWNATGHPTLFALPATGGEPRPLVAGRSEYASWAPDGQQLVFLRDEGSSEAGDLFLLDTKTGVTRALTQDAHSYQWPRFAPDGRLAVISNHEGTFDPYLMEVTTGNLTPLAPGERAASSLVWSPDGRYLGFLRMADADKQGNLQTTLHLYDAQEERQQTLGTVAGELFHAEWSWRPTHAEPYLCLPADHDEYQGLLLVSPEGERRWLMNRAGDLSEPMWSPDGRYLAYLFEQAGNRRLWVMDSHTDKRVDLGVGDGVHEQPRWSPDGHSLTVIFESATQPPDLWRVSLAGPATQLTDGLPASLPQAALTPATSVTFPTFDGRSIQALRYSPREANGAAVVWVHGGPTACHRNRWNPDIQLLTNLGYTVLAPNVRGSTGFGRTFRDLGRMDWGGGDLQDLAAAHDYLHAHGFHRVGIMGGSYGGYMTLMALTRQPERWDAGAALFPIANLVTLYESTRPGDLRPYLEDQIGTPSDRPDFYFERSPINFVEQVRAPLLLLQGANDPRTPLREAESMAEQLAAAGKLHDLHVYDNEGHGFQQRASREDALHRVLAFFNLHLRNQ